MPRKLSTTHILTEGSGLVPFSLHHHPHPQDAIFTRASFPRTRPIGLRFKAAKLTIRKELFGHLIQIASTIHDGLRDQIPWYVGPNSAKQLDR